MKNIAFAIFIILSGASGLYADSWDLPKTEKYCSENKKFCIKIQPKKLESQLSYFSDKVEGKENAGADKNVRDNVCKGTFTAKGSKLWTVPLDNEVAPVDAVVSDDGAYIVTFDNWHRVGYGDNVVAIYSGATGRLIRKLGLADLLTESDISYLPHSTSSIWWREGHKIDLDKRQLILTVVKNERKKEFFDVRIDLATGAVLDPVVDRIPSLQFRFVLSEDPDQDLTLPPAGEESCPSSGEIEMLSHLETIKRLADHKFPRYPAAAKAVGARGKMIFSLTVSESGDVECVKPIAGHPLLRAIMENAIKSWKFRAGEKKFLGVLVVEGEHFLTQNGEIINKTP